MSGMKCHLSVNSVMRPVVASRLLNLPLENGSKKKKPARDNNISLKTIFHLTSSVFIRFFSSQTSVRLMLLRLVNWPPVPQS